MSRKKRKALSLIMLLTLLVQLLSSTVINANVSAESTSPRINEDGTVTFVFKGAAKSVKLAGSFTDWETNAIDMSEQPENVWEVTKQLDAGEYEYKFIVDGTWLTDPLNGEIRNDNSYFKVSLKSDHEEEVQSPIFNEDGSVTFQYVSKGEKSLYLIGDFVDWDVNKAYEMTEKDGVFSVTVKDLKNGDYQYKFLQNNRTWDESITDPSNENLKDGNSVFTVNKLSSPTMNEDGSVTFTYKKSNESAVYLVGSFNDWDVSQAIQLVEKDGFYTTTLTDLQPGTYEYKFILNNRNWDESTTDLLNDVAANGNSVFTIEGAEDITVVSALMDATDEILVTTNKPYKEQVFTVTDRAEGTTVPVEIQAINDKKVKLILKKDYQVDVRKIYDVKVGSSPETSVIMRNILNDEEYYYEGNDLGYTYTKEKTTFKLWAPTASNVSLAIYDEAGKYEGAFVKNHTDGQETKMTRADNGVWSIEINKNLSNKYYMYKVEFADGTMHYAVDPYARSTSANGQRSAIVDLASTDPEGFNPFDKPAAVSMNDAIIYELHVRDFSIDEQSGMKNKGKYLAFTETGTTGPNGVKTGVDSLKELGVNYVHLLPTYDFGSVNERTVDDPNSSEAKFNWGYDPVHFNVPEGSYSTNPQDPTARIKEYKKMVQSLHEQGIRVVMDVVYNHTYMNESTQLEGSSPFDLIIPGYYYRTDDTGKITNGSGTGNEVASERPMVRKYIKDSVSYWANEYGIDGFRFDLMGLIDKQTMQEITTELKEKVDPTIIVYGEPWTGGSTSLPQALQNVKGSQKDQGYAVFNDNIRNAIKGDSDGAGTGFATGASGKEADIVKGVEGSIHDFTNRSSESINYVTAHDNLNLWDKMMKVAGEDSNHTDSTYNPHAVITEENVLDNEWVKRSLLANGIVLTSQGVPFIHAGEEMLRSKYGDHNSYKSPDRINKIRWELKDEHDSVFQYYKGLIKLRKAHSAFKMDDKVKIEKHLQVFKQSDNLVAYQLKDNANQDTWKNIIVIYNANKEAKDVTLPKSGNWNVVVDHTKAGTDIIRSINGDEVKVEGLSMMVLYDEAEAVYTPVATTIDVNLENLAMNPNESKRITAIVKDQKGRVMLGEDITWTSSNEKVATINNGLIDSLNKGETVITAKAGGATTTLNVIVDKLIPTSIVISGNESVFASYSTQLTSSVKDQYDQQMLHAKVMWSSSDRNIATVDNTGKVTGIKPGTVTITAKAGDAIETFDVTIKKNVKRYVQIKYVRPDGDFTGDFGSWNVWVWNTGVKNDQIDFETIEGDTAIANVEIAPETESIGFLLRKGTDWDTAKVSPDSDDHNVSINPNDIVTKVIVETGKQGQVVIPSVNGPVLEDGDVTFFYRDEDLFQADEMNTIDDVKVKIAGKEYEMDYSDENEYFSYKLDGLEEGTYEYTFLVTKDGETKEISDPKNTKNGISKITYNRPKLNIEAKLNTDEITYGEHAVLSVNTSSEQAVGIREMFVNLAPLGGKEKVVIDKSVGAISISPSDTVTTGEKELIVTVIDEFGNTHKQTVVVHVLTKQAVGDELAFDWDEARIYFMLTDRFKDGDPSNNGGKEYDPNHAEAYHGGDFQGIIDELDYLDNLGINTIWITPIVDNIDFNKGLDFHTADGLEAKQYGYHGYWAKDFTELDEHLGDIETFQKLIEQAHDRGIKIMLDVVVNHAGYGMDGEILESWKEDAENLPTSEEIAKLEGMLRTVDEDPTVRGELDNLPDFKTEDPAVRKQIIDWQTAWLEKARTDRGDTIDYFRIDTVKHVDPATWQELKNELAKIDPNFKMIGEYWGASVTNDGGYLGTGQMDSLLDFDFKEKAKAFVDGDIDAVEQYLQERNSQLTNTATLGQFLSSHDQNGFLTEYVNGDVGKLKIASALQITSKGQPVIYYGEELGNSGKSDWEKDGETVLKFGQNRDDMPWELYKEKDPQAMEIHKHYSTLLNIRADYSKVFSKGTREKIAGGDEDDYLIFAREYEEEKVLVGINTTSSQKQATFKVEYPANTTVTDVYNQKEYTVNANQEISVSLPAREDGGTVVLVEEKASEPEKPGTDPGEEPQNPGTEPGEEPQNPGTEPGEEPQNPGTEPGEEPQEPGTDSGEEPQDPGADSGEKPEKPGTNPVQEPNSNDDHPNRGTKPDGNEDVFEPIVETDKDEAKKAGEKLPLTASSVYNWLIIGAMIFVIGFIALKFQNVKRNN
ncbi:type I pullulanase [Metabacillus malikii]|uniref:pullulanase n=1 Tax=Metabacillus malikii TaxID=1504265 RepID=A0ABT9ZB11_9BACI|nr:type I pullulanase [Metabacillus malikii]MDQ0229451.1 pullulanase [Metabacillus malikii]